MIIHKTHSKAELVNIIVNYDIDINNPVKYRKIELSAILVKSLQLIDKIIPVPNMPFLTLIELKEYLVNINPKKTQKIKHYCDNSYCLNNSFFSSQEELLNDIDLIKGFGIIPSVRLAIKKYNANENLNYKVQVYIPDYIQRELDYKKKLKNKTEQSLKVKTGRFYISF